MKINLVAVSRGVSKKGREFGRVCLKFKSDRGSTVKEYFVAPVVLDRTDAKEDDQIKCTLEFDEYGRPEIVEILKADEDLEDLSIFKEEGEE